MEQSASDKLAYINLGARLPSNVKGLADFESRRQLAPATSSPVPQDPGNSNVPAVSLPPIAITGTLGKSTTQKTASGFSHQTPSSATSQGSRSTEKESLIRDNSIVLENADESSKGDDEERESEPASTDESDEISDEDDFPSGDGFEERLTNPREYFRKLELLEESIYKNSAMHLQTSCPSGTRFRMLFPNIDLLAQEDLEMYQTLENAPRYDPTEKPEYLLSHLHHTRNIILSVYINLIRLRRSGFCNNSFSLIVMDMNRSESVARLIPLSLFEVRGLLWLFNTTCWSDNNHFEALDSSCRDILRRLGLYKDALEQYWALDLGLWLGLRLDWISRLVPRLKLWYIVANTLDFAVLSYAGAHIESFDETYLGTRTKSLEIGLPDLTWTVGSLEVIRLRRRSLHCLDHFLRRQVWVFHVEPSTRKSYEDKVNDKLYLSTDIQTLADIWGPLWKCTRLSNPDEIYELSMGNGTLLPWPHDTLPMGLLSSSTEEVYCHWVSWREPLPDTDLLQQDLKKRHFSMDDKLLIGAPPTSNIDLRLNENCQRSTGKLKQDLNEIHALNHLRTSRRARFKDSQSVQVTGGGMGLFASTTTTWKRREGQTWKDALVERWRDSQRLNPVPLGYFAGVEISLCTKNARRIRVVDVLQTKTMRFYLKGIGFAWEKDVERKYFKALRSPRAFLKLWKASKYRENICDAISLCLDALAETGVDDQTGELHALWVLKAEIPEPDGLDDSGDDDLSAKTDSPHGSSSASSDGSSNCDWEATEEYIMSLFRSEHTWTRFLKDTRNTMTMAVVEDNCLECTQDHGRRCPVPYIAEDENLVRRVNGYPVLQTRLQINERLLTSEKITMMNPEEARSYWDVSKTKPKTRFLLGEQGVLEVFENPNSHRSSRKGKEKMTSKVTEDKQPLVVEWYGVKSETLREVRDVDIQQTFYGENPKEHHMEYISTAFPTKPIPIFILSNSYKIA